MKLKSLHDLFVEELQDMYSAENMILKALPKMAEQATSTELRDGFEQHLEQTRGHVQRLDKIFDQRSGVDRQGKKCKAMEAIITENNHPLHATPIPQFLDRATASPPPPAH